MGIIIILSPLSPFIFCLTMNTFKQAKTIMPRIHTKLHVQEDFPLPSAIQSIRVPLPSLVGNVADMSATCRRRRHIGQIPSRQLILADTTFSADTGIRVGVSRHG